MIILAGNEPYYITLAIEKKTKDVLYKEMNVRRFVDSDDETSIIDALNVVPFMAPERIVILQYSDKIVVSDKLMEAFNSVPDTTILIITGKSIDKRSSFYKAHSKQITACEKLTEQRAWEYVQYLVKKEHSRISTDAMKELVRRSGYLENDDITMYALENMVKQLCFLGDITLDNVCALIPQTASGKAYDLTGMLCRKETDRFFEQAHLLLDEGENEIGILSLMQRIFRIAYKEAVVPHGSGVPDWQWKVAGQIPVDTLESILDVIQKAVASIKNGAKARTMFDLCSVEIISLI